MPLLQTLEIEEVITEKQVEQQRSRFKRIVLALSSLMRNFAMGCRRRMNEVDSKKDEPDAKRAKTGTARTADSEDDTLMVENSQASDSPIDLEPSAQGQATPEQTEAEVIT